VEGVSSFREVQALTAGEMAPANVYRDLASVSVRGNPGWMGFCVVEN
jgi:hypothetical protein